MRKMRAFTLIELLVVIGIIAILATVTVVALAPARRNAADTIRKAQLNQIGRLLLNSNTCYAPQDGPGDYDLKTLYDQLVITNPQIKQFVSSVPRDPKSGSDAQSGFRYAYDAAGHCALYSNLENKAATIDLTTLTAPTPGGGTGILRAASPGPNGTDRYYQIGL
jgi:prepilin-type N-terminal cleavage/methylation domain-containing protein